MRRNRRNPSGNPRFWGRHAVAAALANLARDYDRLGGAARRSDRGDYRAAAAAVRRSEAALPRAVAGLEPLGYDAR